MTARLVVRIICMVLAAVVFAGALLVALEIVLAMAGQSPLVINGAVWSERGRTLAWSDPTNRALAGLLVLLGVALLALAWWPRRPEVVAASVPQLDEVGEGTGTGAGPIGAPVAVTVRRRELEAALARAALQVDTITDAEVRVERGHARVEVDTARRERGDLPARVRTAVDERGRQLGVGLGATSVRVREAQKP